MTQTSTQTHSQTWIALPAPKRGHAEGDTPRSLRKRPWFRWVLRLTLLAACMGLGLEVYRVVLGTNVHTIAEGQFYRSATLNEKNLRHYVAELGIRSVINLRGCCPNFDWYNTEVRVLEDLGVPLYEVNFSSYLVPAVPEMHKLVWALETAEQPVLIHCRRGSDRTGLAAAIALLLHSDEGLHDSWGQLNWRFGHLEFSRSGALHQVLVQYEEWLAEHGHQHTPLVARTWLLEHYRPGPYWAEIVPLEVPTELKVRQPEAARFRVYNRSAYPWRFKQSDNSGFHLHFLLRNESRSIGYLGGAGYFEEELLPGEFIDLTLSLPAVKDAGKYDLLVDMAHEGHCWFFLAGSQPYEQEIVVVDDAPKQRSKRRRRAAE